MADGLDVAAALEGKHVFITGATGFIGKVLVEKLLWSVPEVAGLSLLIRARSRGEADERLRREILASPPFARLRALHGEAWDGWARDKVRAVPGDLGRDRFGLAEGAYADLCRRVERVVGCAATVTFDERLDRAVEINARGAERTLALARDGGGLPLVHVSTCFVCGDRRGTVLERPEGGDSGDPGGPGGLDGAGTLAALAEACRAARAETGGEENGAPFVAAGAEQAARYGFHDVYTLTKALGETLILEGRGPVPVAIVRPAIVESALSEPLPGWLQAVRVVDPLLAAYGRGLARDLPGAAGVPLEIVPVDLVANLLVAALAELPAAPESGGPDASPATRVYQLGSARNPVTLGELMDHAREGFRRCPVEDSNGEPVRPPKVRFVPADRLADKLAARLRTVRRRARRWARLGARRRAVRGAPEERRLEYLLRLIRVYRPYLTRGPVFDDRATRSLRQRLTAASRRDFDFEITGVDWRR